MPSDITMMADQKGICQDIAATTDRDTEAETRVDPVSIRPGILSNSADQIPGFNPPTAGNGVSREGDQADGRVISFPEDRADRQRHRPAGAAQCVPESASLLDSVVDRFRHWLHLPDPTPLLVVLGAVAANKMAGEPVWPMIVGPSSGGKTEILRALAGLPDIYLPSTLTESSLLSGTTQRDRAVGASGGLLQQIGPFGIIVFKDFTSIINMNRDARSAVLAALREIHDGRWTRYLGVDGGTELTWIGKLGLIAGCTTAIDSHQSIMATMGERFVFCRLPETDELQQASRALDTAGSEDQMRADLRAAVHGLFTGLTLPTSRPALTPWERERLSSLAAFVARGRSAVERDAVKRDVINVHQAEAPARLVKVLSTLYAGIRAVGVNQQASWHAVVKVGLDCLPPLRRSILVALADSPSPLGVTDLMKSADGTEPMVRRAVEDLTLHRVVERFPGSGRRGDAYVLHPRTYNQYQTVMASVPVLSSDAVCV